MKRLQSERRLTSKTQEIRMATSHSTSRRQRAPRRTTASTAHARHRSTGARQNRTSEVSAVTAAPVLDAKVVEVKVEDAPVKVVRPMRSPDADDHLAAYFRQLAEHELLTPEDERELSQGIEDTEILTWERVLSRADAVRAVLALVEPNLEQPVKFPKLLKAADDLVKSKRASKDNKLQKKLTAAAKETASALRLLDLDRVHIDAITRELYRARAAALGGEETWWIEGASKDAGLYVDGVRQAHRDA